MSQDRKMVKTFGVFVTDKQSQLLDDPLLTVREVAKKLRVDDTTVRRWIHNGVLDAVNLPHMGKRQTYRVRQSTLDTLINSPGGVPQ